MHCTPPTGRWRPLASVYFRGSFIGVEEEARSVVHMYTVSTMASKDSSTSVNQAANSSNNDGDTSELCPGFKDVDAFVKVSEQRKQILLIWICLYVQANTQVGNMCCYELFLTVKSLVVSLLFVVIIASGKSSCGRWQMKQAVDKSSSWCVFDCNKFRFFPQFSVFSF